MRWVDRVGLWLSLAALCLSLFAVLLMAARYLP